MGRRAEVKMTSMIRSRSEKGCSRCMERLSVDYFYQQPASADGYMHICKDCHKSAVRARRVERLDYYREYDRKRADKPHRVRARREYVQTDAGKEARRKATRSYRERNPMRKAAHHAVGNAIRDGKLVRQPCEVCQSTDRIHAHHDDYTKPLDVRWLCEPCHKEWHRHNEPIYGPDHVRGRA